MYNHLKVDLSLNIWIHSLKIPPKLICVVSFGDESLHWLFINNNITLIVQKTKLSSSEWAFICSIIVIIMITIQIVNKIQIGALQHRAWVTCCTLPVSRCKNVLNFKLFYSTYGPIQIIMCMDVSCRILPQCVSGMHACIKYIGNSKGEGAHEQATATSATQNTRHGPSMVNIVTSLLATFCLFTCLRAPC